MTMSSVQQAPKKQYRMRHAYLTTLLSGGEPFAAEVWFGEGRRRKDDLLWFSTNFEEAQHLVDQINTGRE